VAAGDALGKRFNEVFPNNDSTRTVKAMYYKAMNTNKPQHFTVEYPGGQNIIHEINAYPTEGGISFFVKDVTESRRSEVKMIELEALKRTNQAKSELLANVSHELRTPLTSIKGFIETLLETDVKWSKKQQLEFLHQANNETDRLLLLIKDLLDMSRIESGKLKLDKHTFQVCEILDSVSGVLSIITNMHKLKIASLANLPPIQADKVRIGQVITNLVENSIKFSSEGSQILVDAVSIAGYVVISV